MNRKKLAICISGQARNFEFPLAEIYNLFDPKDTSYFISTWKKRGIKIRKYEGKLLGDELLI